MNFSRGWAKECTEFTSNHEPPIVQFRTFSEILTNFSTSIHRQGLLCTGKSLESPKPARSLLEVSPPFIDIFHTQV